jgi:hypothetical protein
MFPAPFFTVAERKKCFGVDSSLKVYTLLGLLIITRVTSAFCFGLGICHPAIRRTPANIAIYLHKAAMHRCAWVPVQMYTWQLDRQIEFKDDGERQDSLFKGSGL